MKKIITLLLFCLLFISCEYNDLLSSKKTLIIASKKIDCMGFAPQSCFLVKEKDAQNWDYFYDNIAGFNYEAGFEYEVIVSEKEIENPPQDASSIETTLIEIISKIEKISDNLPN